MDNKYFSHHISPAREEISMGERERENFPKKFVFIKIQTSWWRWTGTNDLQLFKVKQQRWEMSQASNCSVEHNTMAPSYVKWRMRSTWENQSVVRVRFSIRCLMRSVLSFFSSSTIGWGLWSRFDCLLPLPQHYPCWILAVGDWWFGY